VNGLITFRLGEREYATALSSVREVVRLEGLADLPGMRPPLAGVLDLRGTALPVMDLRVGVGDRRGDVLVLEGTGAVADGLVGIAVDKVRAVVADDALPAAGGVVADGGVLPTYVLDVLRGAAGPVFLVDLPAMLGSASQPVPA
jgi:purine-binding chemotaxis protein CheW